MCMICLDVSMCMLYASSQKRGVLCPGTGVTVVSHYVECRESNLGPLKATNTLLDVTSSAPCRDATILSTCCSAIKTLRDWVEIPCKHLPAMLSSARLLTSPVRPLFCEMGKRAAPQSAFNANIWWLLSRHCRVTTFKNASDSWKQILVIHNNNYKIKML